jgi:hypothetical protein
VAVAVAAFVAVSDGGTLVGVTVGVTVEVSEGTAVFDGSVVLVGTGVSDGTLVLDGVAVSVGIAVLVGVHVGVEVDVGGDVAVCVGVLVGGVPVTVGLGVPPPMIPRTTYISSPVPARVSVQVAYTLPSAAVTFM